MPPRGVSSQPAVHVDCVNMFEEGKGNVSAMRKKGLDINVGALYVGRQAECEGFHAEWHEWARLKLCSWRSVKLSSERLLMYITS